MTQALSDPAAFRNPHSTRNKMLRGLWMVVQATVFRWSPRFCGAYRSWLLRAFGARIGQAGVHATVTVWAPWRLSLGRQAYIAEGVRLYNPFGIAVGDRVVISQRTFLCTASHDYTLPGYPLIGAPITIKDDCWIAAEAFVGPGVTINAGGVVGARAVVTRDVPPWTVVAGNPARPIKKRLMQGAARSAP